MGSDKALISWNGSPLIVHVRDCLQARFPEVLVSAPRGRYNFLGLTVIEDEFPGLGPLAGISAALSFSAKPFVFVAACDMPLIVPEMIDAILRDAEPGRPTVARDGTRLHPLFGVYPASAADQIHERLMSGQVRVLECVRDMQSVVVDLSPWQKQLVNVNTAADFPRGNFR